MPLQWKMTVPCWSARGAGAPVTRASKYRRCLWDVKPQIIMATAGAADSGSMTGMRLLIMPNPLPLDERTNRTVNVHIFRCNQEDSMAVTEPPVSQLAR